MIDTAEAYGNEKEIAHMAYAPLGQGNRNEMYQEPVVLALAEKYNKTPAQIIIPKQGHPLNQGVPVTFSYFFCFLKTVLLLHLL